MKLLTVSDVSTMLQLSESTIYDLAQKGDMPSRKIRGAVRFIEAEIIAWLDTCKQGGAARKQPKRPIPKLKHLRLSK